MTNWSLEDSTAAHLEGWDVFDAEGELQIQRLDEEAKLPGDLEAWILVTDRAKAGSALHIKALSLIHENERERINKADQLRRTAHAR